MLKTLVRNVTSNWTGFAVQAVLTFFLTPFVLHSLGSTRYGIWALVIGLTGYYGLLDIGVRSGMLQYMTRHLAVRDYAKLNQTASTAFVALALGGGLVGIVSLVLSFLTPLIFAVPADAVWETRCCILIIGVSVAIQFTYYPVSTVLAATQRHDLITLVVVGTRVATAAVTFLALKLGYGLVGLCIVNTLGDQLSYNLRKYLAYRVLPELVVSRRLARWESFWPIVSFGSWSFLVQSASRLRSRADPIIIGLFMPIAAITPYALALSLKEYFEDLFVPIGFVFFPLVTDLDARNEASTLRTVYLTGSKLLLLLAVVSGMISAVFAAPFFRLWVGPSVTSGGTFPSPATLYYIMIVPAVCTSSQRIAYQVLSGTRRVKQLSLIVIWESLSKLVLSVVLVHYHGLIGVAFGTLLPTVLFESIVIPAAVCRVFGVTVGSYVRNVLIRPLLVLAALTGLLISCYGNISTASNWAQLLVYATLVGGAALLLIVCVGLTRAEQQRLVLQPAMRLACRAGWRRGIHTVEASVEASDSSEAPEAIR